MQAESAFDSGTLESRIRLSSIPRSDNADSSASGKDSMPEQTSTTPRTVRRLVPRQSATVAVYRGEQQVGYGILANVSEAGACIVTDSLMAPGTDLRLKLSFYEQPRLFETIARVVWSREASASDRGFDGLRIHGLRFTVTSTVERSRLVALLQKEDSFVTVFKPTVTEFDRLASSLSNELDALGEKIDKNVGRESV
jgi:hypothetical protein